MKQTPRVPLTRLDTEMHRLRAMLRRGGMTELWPIAREYVYPRKALEAATQEKDVVGQ